MLKHFLMIVAAASSAAAQVKLEAISATDTTTYMVALPLPAGGTLLVGSQPWGNPIGFGSATTIHLVFGSLDAGGFGPPPVYGGHGNDVPHAAAIDPSGNVWIVGDTDSDDFALVNPIVARKVPYRTAGFVMEIDPKAGKLLFATYLGGQQYATGGPPIYATHATALAIDSAGNVYVGGDTDEPDFPVTPGAFTAGRPGTSNFYDDFAYSYLMKISPAGKLVYSALMGTGTSQCMGGSRCIGRHSTSETVSGLAVDASGAVTAAGVAGGSWNPGGGYVTRVAADGTRLLWSTAVPTALGYTTTMFLCQDSGGTVDLFGNYVTVLRFDESIGPILGTPGLFAARLKSDGSGLVVLTDLGQSADAAAAGLILDSAGNPWMAGTSSSAQFPNMPGVPNLGADFMLRLGAAGANAQKLFRLPRGTVTAPPALDSSGNLLLLEAGSALLTLPSNYSFDSPAIVGLANAASFALNTGVYPGTLLTIYGFDLPASPQVSIGGAAAPLLYASPNQVNVQVPFGMASLPPAVTIQVTGPSGTAAVQTFQTSSVGISTADGVHAAALNQDGSVNSVTNPATPGSIVSLFGTGAFWPPETPDNTPAASAMSLDQGGSGFQVVTVLGRPIPLNMLYFGAAPGLIQGVFQINVQLPLKSMTELSLQIQSVYFGDSNVVQVYVK